MSSQATSSSSSSSAFSVETPDFPLIPKVPQTPKKERKKKCPLNKELKVNIGKGLPSNTFGDINTVFGNHSDILQSAFADYRKTEAKSKRSGILKVEDDILPLLEKARSQAIKKNNHLLQKMSRDLLAAVFEEVDNLVSEKLQVLLDKSHKAASKVVLATVVPEKASKKRKVIE